MSTTLSTQSLALSLSLKLFCRIRSRFRHVFSTANAQKYLNKRYTRDDKSIVLVGVYGSYFNSFSKKLKSIVGRLSFQQTL